MGIKVKEIMERDTYILREGDTVKQALSYLYNKEVSGVPIVNVYDEVVGYISDGDILHQVARKKPFIFDMQGGVSSITADLESFDDKVSEILDMDVMRIASHKVVTVNQDTDIDIVAEILSKKKYKKVAIVDDEDRIVGIVTRWHIVSHIIKSMLDNAEE